MSLLETIVRNPEKLVDFLTKIRLAGEPEQFDEAFLRNLGFAETAYSLQINLFFRLGLIDENGVPTEDYYRFIESEAESRRVVAEKVWEGYALIFAEDKQAHALPEERIRDIFRKVHEYQKSETYIMLLARSFKALTAYAEWDHSRKTGTLTAKATAANGTTNGHHNGSRKHAAGNPGDDTNPAAAPASGTTNAGTTNAGTTNSGTTNSGTTNNGLSGSSGDHTTHKNGSAHQAGGSDSPAEKEIRKDGMLPEQKVNRFVPSQRASMFSAYKPVNGRRKTNDDQNRKNTGDSAGSSKEAPDRQNPTIRLSQNRIVPTPQKESTPAPKNQAASSTQNGPVSPAPKNQSEPSVQNRTTSSAGNEESRILKNEESPSRQNEAIPVSKDRPVQVPKIEPVSDLKDDESRTLKNEESPDPQNGSASPEADNEYRASKSDLENVKLMMKSPKEKPDNATEKEKETGSDVLPRALFKRAELLRKMNRIDEAISAYDQIIQYYNNRDQNEQNEVLKKTYISKAEILEQAEQYDQALTAYEEMISRFYKSA